MKNDATKQTNEGFEVIFAGADLSAFNKSSEKEAETVVSNCSIKLALKTRDSVGKE